MEMPGQSRAVLKVYGFRDSVLTLVQPQEETRTMLVRKMLIILTGTREGSQHRPRHQLRSEGRRSRRKTELRA